MIYTRRKNVFLLFITFLSCGNQTATTRADVVANNESQDEKKKLTTIDLKLDEGKYLVANGEDRLPLSAEGYQLFWQKKGSKDKPKPITEDYFTANQPGKYIITAEGAKLKKG